MTMGVQNGRGRTPHRFTAQAKGVTVRGRDVNSGIQMNTRAWLIPAAILLGLTGLLVLLVMSLPYGRAHPDDFYLGRLFMDLYREGGRWSDWVPPSAPSLFPDGLIYGLLAWFTMDILWVSALYGVVIALATGLVVYAFSRQVLEQNLAALGVACFALFGMIAMGEDVTTWSRPSQHFLTYFNLALAGTTLLVALKRPAMTGWVILAASLAVMSDFLFIPLWLGAASTGIGLAWLCGRLSFTRALSYLAMVVVSVLLGYIAYKLLVPHPQDNPVWASGMSLRDVATSLSPHINALRYLGRNLLSPWFLLPVATWLLAWGLYRGDRDRSALILLGGGFIVGGILANLYTVGLGFHSTTSRAQYHIFVWNGEILLFALALGAMVLHKRMLAVPLFVTIGAASLGLAAVMPAPAERIAKFRQFEAEVACVTAMAESAGLRYGLASFGNSDRFTVVSDGRLFLNTMTGNRLRTKHYVLSRAWNKHKYHFVLVNNSVDQRVYRRKKMHYPIAANVVEKALGEPDDVLTCKQHSLLVYRQAIGCRENDRGTFDCTLAGDQN